MNLRLVFAWFTLAASVTACGTRIEIADDDDGGGSDGGDGGATSSAGGAPGTTSSAGGAPGTTSSAGGGSTSDVATTSSAGGGDASVVTVTTGPEPFVPPICFDLCEDGPDCSVGECIADCVADYDPACDAEFNAYYTCADAQTVCNFAPCAELSGALQQCKAD